MHRVIERGYWSSMQCLRLSPAAARKYYGFDQIRQRAQDVEDALKQQIKQIRSTVFEMALDREKAIALSCGIGTSDSSSALK